MTEYYNEQPVDAAPLLAATPRSLISSVPPDSVTFLAGMRDAIRFGWDKQEPPVGVLPDDPANVWGLDAHELAFAGNEVSRFIDAQPPDELSRLLTRAYPDDEVFQTRARNNLSQLLHDAARGALLLPRRHMYQEFRVRREATLRAAIGETATRQLLSGKPLQLSTYSFLQTQHDLEHIAIPRLHELSAMPEPERQSVMQQIIGSAFALSQIFLRHAPEYLTDAAAGPAGLERLAHRALYYDVAKLRYALINTPGIAAREVITAFLKGPYFGDEVARLSGRRLDFEKGPRTDELMLQERRQELETLLAGDSARPELLTAKPGDVIELAPPDEILSKATLARLLQGNLRALGLVSYLEAAELREELRTAVPQFSDKWEDVNLAPHVKLLGDFYGSVRNPRIIVLPASASFIATHYRRYAQGPHDVPSGRFTRMAVVVDLRSSARRPSEQLTRVVEVCVYPNHFGGQRETIMRSVRKKQVGRQAVLDLWRESAIHATELEAHMMQRAFSGGSVGGSGGRGRKGGK